MKKISMVINADDRLGHISPEIYGQFFRASRKVYLQWYICG